jgi:hypothetical protein
LPILIFNSVFSFVSSRNPLISAFEANMPSTTSITSPITHALHVKEGPIPLSTLLTSPTLPAPPFVSIPGVHNFRDIGGYSIPNISQSVQRNLVYRCCEPSRITQDGCARLRALGITHIFDIRGPKEIEGTKEAMDIHNPNIPAGERYMFNVPVGM